MCNCMDGWVDRGIVVCMDWWMGGLVVVRQKRVFMSNE